MTLQWGSEKELRRLLDLLGIWRWRVTVHMSIQTIMIELPRGVSADDRWKIRQHGPLGIHVGFAALRWWECHVKRRRWEVVP